NALRVRRPHHGIDPAIEVWRRVADLAGRAFVQHQAEAVAFVAAAQLRAIGDVLAIGRIQWCAIAAGIGGNFLGSPPATGTRKISLLVLVACTSSMLLLKAISCPSGEN